MKKGHNDVRSELSASITAPKRFAAARALMDLHRDLIACNDIRSRAASKGQHARLTDQMVPKIDAHLEVIEEWLESLRHSGERY